MDLSYYCISTANPDLFKHNKRSIFTNNLPELVSRPLNYSLSLASLNFEKSFVSIDAEPGTTYILLKYSISATRKTKILKKHQGKIIHNTITYYDERDNLMVTHIGIKSDRYSSISELLTSINQIFKNLELFSQVAFRFRTKPSYKLQLKVGKKIELCAINNILLSVLGFNWKDFPLVKYGYKTLSDIMPNLKEISEKNNIYTFDSSSIQLNHRFYIFPHGIHSTEKEIYQNQFIPSLVKVYCKQIDENIESSGKSRLLAICPGVDNNDQDIYSFEPIASTRSKINVSDFTSCRIELLDQNNKRLNFSLGGATYIRLIISKNNTKNEMFISVHSDDVFSKKLFTNNSNTNFTIHLPSVISSDNSPRWTMKLMNFSMAKNLCNITSDTNKFFITRQSQPDKQIIIPVRFYRKFEDLILQINLVIIENGFQKLAFKTNKEKLTIFNSDDSDIVIHLPKVLSVILGYDNFISTTKNNIIVKPNDRFEFSYQNHLQAGVPRYCKIICPQVKSSVFGGTRESVLSFVSLQSGVKNNNSCFYQFFEPQEVEINMTELNSLSFKISPENSEDTVELDDTNVTTHMTLSISRYY